MTAVVAVLAALALTPVTLTVHTTDGHSTQRVAHLRCRGARAHADGFLRTGAARACARARAIAGFLSSPPPAHRLCTQIYGGPERARITGAIGARHVDRAFARRNGCEITDWEKARPLVPRANGLGATTTP
ncbi:MAG: hypothetical protein QOC78_2629 [Solirubrobacteraceae bacterium]|nr:hypothetical protein [Solirubrobacteraceae bacterium]MEA2396259.1 hypothetical protein [Solirubrobacteraceae bacterium]